MEALPIFLDSLVTSWGAVLISVTLILLFGEIIPQSVCTRHGLAIGATVAPLVRVLIWICFPVTYPISKLLDFLLGHGGKALFRRAELKTLVNLHGNEAGKGGELMHDETTIIAGALELTEKTVGVAMTSISDTFAIDINATLNRDTMNSILDNGHSRIPVYYEEQTNIIGVILVKNLLTINPKDEIPVKSVTICKIRRVPETMPLYDILNEFQKGHSHMAVVIRKLNKLESQLTNGNPVGEKQLKIVIEGNNSEQDNTQEAKDKSSEHKTKFYKWKSFPSSQKSIKEYKTKKWNMDIYSDILEVEHPLPKPDEEVIGIITLEDVMEELLQEEIYDETDHHFEDSSHSAKY